MTATTITAITHATARAPRRLSLARQLPQAAKLIVFYGVLTVVGLAFMVPYVFAIFGSLKPESQILSTPAWVPPLHPAWSNYPDAFLNFSQVQTDFGRYMANTALVTVALTVGQVVFSMLGAYGFARLKFPGREAIFWLYLATLMVPSIVTIIPLYTEMHYMHLVNTYWAVFLPYALGSPYTIFLMRQFFRNIPQDVIDAAHIDGCGEVGVLRRVVIPLSRPVIITAALIAFVFGWNNFLWPLVVLNSQSHYLLTDGLANFSTGPGTGEYLNLLLVGAIITLVPMLVLFIVFNKYIVRSIQLTSGK
jgi:multiple sugar transport system permease protein